MRELLLIPVGLVVGMAVASGVFALITMIGVIPRIAARLELSDKMVWFETCIVLGGTLGNLWRIFLPEWNLATNSRFGVVGIFLANLILILYGVFAGTFVGCVAMSLAEVLKVMPIMMKRMRLTIGVSVLILALALGKMAGGLYQIFH